MAAFRVEVLGWSQVSAATGPGLLNLSVPISLLGKTLLITICLTQHAEHWTWQV